MRSNSSVINVYKKNNIRSEVVTQLIYGDTFKNLKKKESWLKIKNNRDNYEGYIKTNKFLPNQKNTHKIFKLSSLVYKKPNKKYKTKIKISFGSRIKISEKKGNFYKFDNLWINKKDLKKINTIDKNPFKNINRFLKVKYVWGGKHYSGVDCSGLIQLLLNYNEKFCPRDASQQIKYFKKKVRLKNIKKNDLIFWKDHVAVAISKQKLIHAYGPLKKVVTMPIKKAISKIYKTAGLSVMGIRRIS